jgi:hypothetical protein
MTLPKALTMNPAAPPAVPLYLSRPRPDRPDLCHACGAYHGSVTAELLCMRATIARLRAELYQHR